MSTVTDADFEPTNATLKASQTGTQMNTKAKRGNSRFDYNTIDAEFQDEAREAAKRIHRRMRTAIYDTGRDLIMIKEKLGHGQFGDWIRGEFNMDRRTATNYMNAARLQEQKREIISHFRPTTVYTLAAPSTPVAVIDEVLALAEGGTFLSHPQIRMKIRDAKRQERSTQTDYEQQTEQERDEHQDKLAQRVVDALQSQDTDRLVEVLMGNRAKQLAFARHLKLASKSNVATEDGMSAALVHENSQRGSMAEFDNRLLHH